MEEKNDSAALLLLKKSQKGMKRAIFSRLGLMLAMLLAQFLFMFMLFFWLEEYAATIQSAVYIFSLIMVLFLLNSRHDPTAKITWLVIIMLMPVFGSLLFAFTQSEWGHRAVKARVNYLVTETRDKIPQSVEVMRELNAVNPGAASLACYLHRSGCFPVYDRTAVTYFASGEEKLAELLIQLEKAEKFIFLEYFIIDEGEMWGKVLNILAAKARAGVDVRLMYDGTCDFTTLSPDYPRRLEALGIKCKRFAPVSPFLSTHYNYRDHRKIIVIDGHTAFTGGINLADEYINKKVRFGHWKDAAVMLCGEAVRSFTLMFLQMWSVDMRVPDDFDHFLNFPVYPKECTGFVIPYGDCPLDGERTGERVYMDMLNRAKSYVHIMTPYLILDGEMEGALKFAAERGVEVSIILPGIPDKVTPYALAYTHYASLLEAGVKIYEYSPGFVHAKVFVSDTREAVVGTINLDYRSLYHHFECAAYLCGVECIPQIEADFQQTLAKCREVTRETMKKEKAKRKIRGVILKVVAPLL